MFYFFSKLITGFLLPLPILLWGIIYVILSKNRAKSIKILKFLLVFLYLGSNEFLMNEVLLCYEYPPTSIQKLKTHDVGILLTGGITQETKSPHDRIYLSPAAERMTQTLNLYKQGKIRKVLVSGMSDDGNQIQKRHSILLFLLENGVKKSDIFIEPASRNTRENAVFSKAFIDKNLPETHSFLLITSAFHLRRAKGCFDKVGLQTIPFATHFLTSDRHFDLKNIFPQEETFLHFRHFLREVIGLITYKMMGYC